MARITGTTQTVNYSGVDLRATIQAIQAAGQANNVGQLAASIAAALTKIQADSQTQNARMRDLGQPLANDANLPAKLLVSSDRLTGQGLAVTGDQPPNPQGQRWEIFIHNGRGYLYAVDYTGYAPGVALPVTVGGPGPNSGLGVLGNKGNLDANVATSTINAGSGAAYCYSAAAQSIPNSAWTALTFDTNIYVPLGSMHSTVTNPSRIINQETTGSGVWLITVTCSWTANSTGERAISLFKNGSQLVNPVWQFRTPGAATSVVTSLSVIVSNLTWGFGDYLEAGVFQTSGAPLSTLGGYTYIAVVRLMSA